MNIDINIVDNGQQEAEVTMFSEGYEDDKNIEPLLLG